MASAVNPYQTPEVDLGLGYSSSDASGDAVAMRNQYLAHEGAIQGIGSFFYLSAFMFACMILMGLVAAGTEKEGGLIIAGMGLFFASIFGWMGTALRRLNPNVKVPVGLISGIGLLNLPIGTLINGYILYCVFGAKGKVVFSEEYAAVRAQTPDMKYKTPLSAWIGLGILMALVLAGIIATQIG